MYGLATGAAGHGVYAKSTQGTALVAESTASAADGINTIGNRYGVVTGAGTLAPLVLVGSGVVPPPIQAKTHFQGEIIMDVNEDFWACVAGGNPGTFRRITGPQGLGSLRVLPSTTRIYDSRPGTQPPSGNKGKVQRSPAEDDRRERRRARRCHGGDDQRHGHEHEPRWLLRVLHRRVAAQLVAELGHRQRHSRGHHGGRADRVADLHRAARAPAAPT